MILPPAQFLTFKYILSNKYVVGGVVHFIGD